MVDIRVKAPRKRASTPRSRTGCITCKIRRLKCGEEKPGCVRCLKSGWQCDYDQSNAAQPPSSRSSGATIIGHSPHSSASVRSSQSPGPHSRPLQAQVSSPNCLIPSQLEQHEQMYFQTFLDRSIACSINGDETSWVRPAALQSHSSPCIRHAIVAIGALQMSTKKSLSGYDIMDVTQSGHRQFALQQYEKAIIKLRNAISSQNYQQGMHYQSIIMSCLVLAYFDAFIGNGGFAVQHIRYARKVLFKSGTELKITPALPDWNDVDEVVAWMFLMLDMQVLSALGPDEDRTSVVMEPQRINIFMPASFKNHEEARQYLKLLLWDADVFLYQTSFNNFCPWKYAPKPATELRDHLIEQIHTFHAALEPHLVEEQPNQHSHPLLRGSSVQLCSMTTLVKLMLSLNSPEGGTDTLQPYFDYIVSICQEILEYEARVDATEAGQERFSFEVRTIEPLFLVSTKCRDPATRRKAISLLLSSHRREMMWDSLMAGNIAHWVMQIEEEGADPVGFIPDTSRVWGLAVELDLQRKLALVKCRVGGKAPNEYSERTMELECDQSGWTGIN